MDQKRIDGLIPSYNYEYEEFIIDTIRGPTRIYTDFA